MAIPKILIGMPGPWADDYWEHSDHYTCKIGGFPDWPIEEVELRLLNLLDCRSCGSSNLCLLAQVYAPISSDSLQIEERVIYIFGCVKPECGSDPLSWRALRVQNHQDREVPNMNGREVVPSVSSSGSVQNTNWWEDLDNASTDDDVDLEELGKALSQAAISASSSKQQKSNGYSELSADPSPSKPRIRSVDRNKPVVPCFYIYTQEEPSSTELTRVCSDYSISIKENQIDADDDQGQKETWEDESYEYDRALNADRTYLKFKKRIDAYPEQCLRYSYRGKPLLATGSIKDPETCSRCGEKRQYELQLMPQLLYFIQEQADKCHKHLFENWNWMTLVVYTCSKSCSNLLKHESCNNGWVIAEETVLVQLE